MEELIIPDLLDDEYISELLDDLRASRVMVLNTNIEKSVLERYILWILKWNSEDEADGIPVEKRRPIYIYINSPGGNTIDGLNLADTIKLSKTPVIGVCFGMAASMGYHILISCHKRYVFPNSVLLQHDGEVLLQNSTSKARDTMKFFDSMEERIKKHVLENTGIDEEMYQKIYKQEYYMFPEEAKSLCCIDYIIGQDCDLTEILP